MEISWLEKSSFDVKEKYEPESKGLYADHDHESLVKECETREMTRNRKKEKEKDTL
jgi:hypothetical protein